MKPVGQYFHVEQRVFFHKAFWIQISVCHFVDLKYWFPMYIFEKVGCFWPRWNFDKISWPWNDYGYIYYPVAESLIGSNHSKFPEVKLWGVFTGIKVPEFLKQSYRAYKGWWCFWNLSLYSWPSLSTLFFFWKIMKKACCTNRLNTPFIRQHIIFLVQKSQIQAFKWLVLVYHLTNKVL